MTKPVNNTFSENINLMSETNYLYNSSDRNLNFSSNFRRPLVHNISHFFIPLSIAYLTHNVNNNWKSAAQIYLLANFIDIDHILSDPVYDPARCSIDFHPLHSKFAILGYSLLTLFPGSRTIGNGLLIHMGLDYVDCSLMQSPAYSSFSDVLIKTQPINFYTLQHFIFWYAIGKYSNSTSDEMLSISMTWEVLELKLPYKFAQESWLNKSIDLLTNIIAFNVGFNNK